MENNFEITRSDQPPPREDYNTSTIYTNDGGKLELVRQEPAETFSYEDEYKLAAQGLIVLSADSAQQVYRYVEAEELK